MKKIIHFFLAIFLFYSSFATANQSVIPYTALGPDDPLAPAYLFNSHNSIGHGVEKRSQEPGQLPPPMSFAGEPEKWQMETAKEKIAPDCNLDAMLALSSSSAVISYLQAHKNLCLQFLWTYDSRMSQLFTNSNLSAVVNAVAANTAIYNGTDDHNLDELLFFLRVAYYQAFYNNLPFNAALLKPSVVTALNNIFINPHIFDNTNVAGLILNETLSVIDGAQVATELLPKIENTLAVFADQLLLRLSNSNQQLAIYTALFTLSRSINNNNLTAIDANLINQLQGFSLMALTDQYTYVTNSAIWVLGQIYNKIPLRKLAASEALEQTYHQQAQWSTAWLWSIRAFTLGSDCVSLSDGERLCLSKIKAELKSRLFPKRYIYENETLSFRTGLTQPAIDSLYYATKEVKGQFSRLTGNVNWVPVVNDHNAALQVIIYASPSDYSKYHTFLFNLSSNNGGLYVEQDGTYYTYQRTASQSFYTLEELTRHEYTHYLIQRYLVTGLWGATPLYDNNRMVFIDEGLAEFFTGSTTNKGVQQRKSLVSQIQSDGSAHYMNLSQILSATYGDFTFYRYAGLLFHFFYTQQLDIFNQFISLILASNGAGIDALVAQLKMNGALNTAYLAYLNAAVANLANLSTPTTLAPQVKNLIYSTPAQIQTILLATTVVSQANCSVSANKTNILFNCQGQLSGPVQNTQNFSGGWYAVNSSADKLIKAANATSTASTNLNWMNCGFGTLQWRNSGAGYLPFAQYSCDGPLSSTTQPTPPSPGASQLQADFHKTRLGLNATCTASGLVSICTVPAITALVAVTQNDSVVRDLVMTALVTMQNEVLALSPAQYTNLSCVLQPHSISIINHPPAQKYGTFSGICTL